MSRYAGLKVFTFKFSVGSDKHNLYQVMYYSNLKRSKQVHRLVAVYMQTVVQTLHCRVYSTHCNKSICRPGNIPCNSCEHYQLQQRNIGPPQFPYSMEFYQIWLGILPALFSLPLLVHISQVQLASFLLCRSQKCHRLTVSLQCNAAKAPACDHCVHGLNFLHHNLYYLERILIF